MLGCGCGTAAAAEQLGAAQPGIGAAGGRRRAQYGREGGGRRRLGERRIVVEVGGLAAIARRLARGVVADIGEAQIAQRRRAAPHVDRRARVHVQPTGRLRRGLLAQRAAYLPRLALLLGRAGANCRDGSPRSLGVSWAAQRCTMQWRYLRCDGEDFFNQRSHLP